MNIQLAKTILIILILLLYALTESVLILSLASVVAILVMIPDQYLTKVLGYVAFIDVVMSMYVVSTATASATATGLVLAVFTALGLSLTLRGLRKVYGCERMQVNGRTDLGGIIAELSTYGISFLRSWVTALFKGSKVEAPSAPKITWIQHEQGVGWFNGFRFAFGMSA